MKQSCFYLNMRILSCKHSIINSYSIVFLEKYSRLCESVNPFGAQVFDLVITIYHLESILSKNAEFAQIKDMYMYMYLLKKVFLKTPLYTYIFLLNFEPPWGSQFWSKVTICTIKDQHYLRMIAK